MTLARPIVVIAWLVPALTALTACAGSAVDERPGAGGTSTIVRTTPGPVRTVVRSAHVYPAGRTVDFTAQAGVALRLGTSEPSRTHGRLSSTHGYPPARGWYVTLRLTIANAGSQTVQVGPADFFVRVTGKPGKVTSYDGNAPYSGGAKQLDTTYLDPGQRVRAPLTFDVSVPHGRLAYAPDGSPAIVWTF